MSKHQPIKPAKRGSLLERAADVFGVDAAAGMPTIDIAALPPEPVRKARRAAPEPVAPATITVPPVAMDVPPADAPAAARPSAAKDLARAAPAIVPGRHATIDRANLERLGMVVPGGPVSGIAEEYRIIKRELFRGIVGGPARPILPRGHRILIASANPGEGKTFSAVNLALSLAAEADFDVLLIDADIAKPSVLKLLGVADGPGLMDALADPHLPLADCLIQTDLPGLKLMPAGTSTSHDSELLSSSRTETVLAQLEAGAPGRILLFDSPPVLAASPAGVLAGHVGQLVMVVRADTTMESSLRDAISLVGGCPHIQLLLNGVKFSPGGRRFGTYYGQGGAA